VLAEEKMRADREDLEVMTQDLFPEGWKAKRDFLQKKMVSVETTEGEV